MPRSDSHWLQVARWNICSCFSSQVTSFPDFTSVNKCQEAKQVVVVVSKILTEHECMQYFLSCKTPFLAEQQQCNRWPSLIGFVGQSTDFFPLFFFFSTHLNMSDLVFNFWSKGAGNIFNYRTTTGITPYWNVYSNAKRQSNYKVWGIFWNSSGWC